MATKKTTSRYRNFATVIYPDSMPKDVWDIIDSWHIQVFVSPLHDSDMNPTGEAKEAHYHVMIMYDNVHTEDQARELFSQINGKGCEIIKSIRGMARYLCHLDNPEKHRYCEDKVSCFGGADYYTTIASVADQVDGIKQIHKYIRQNCIYSYAELCDRLEDDHPELFRLTVLSTTLHLNTYLKARYWEDNCQ